MTQVTRTVKDVEGNPSRSKMGVTLTAVRRGLTAVGRQLRFEAFTESSTSESVTVTRTPSRPGLGPGPGPGPGVDAVLFSQQLA